MKKLLSLIRPQKAEEKAMTLESSKTLGLVGAILTLIGAFGVFGVPYLSILSLVGIIIILIGLRGLADVYQDKGIFNNSLYGFIAGIIGVVVAAVVLIADVLINMNALKAFIQQIYPSWNGSWSTISSLAGQTANTSNLDTKPLVPFIELALLALVILYVFLIVWAFFARKSLKTLATKSNEGLFGTASLVPIIGAALTIIIVGVVIMWIAVLMMAIAFYRLKPQTEQPPVTYVTPPSTPTPV